MHSEAPFGASPSAGSVSAQHRIVGGVLTLSDINSDQSAALIVLTVSDGGQLQLARKNEVADELVLFGPASPVTGMYPDLSSVADCDNDGWRDVAVIEAAMPHQTGGKLSIVSSRSGDVLRVVREWRDVSLVGGKVIECSTTGEQGWIVSMPNVNFAPWLSVVDRVGSVRFLAGAAATERWRLDGYGEDSQLGRILQAVADIDGGGAADCVISTDVIVGGGAAVQLVSVESGKVLWVAARPSSSGVDFVHITDDKNGDGVHDIGCIWRRKERGGQYVADWTIICGRTGSEVSSGHEIRGKHESNPDQWAVVPAIPGNPSALVRMWRRAGAEWVMSEVNELGNDGASWVVTSSVPGRCTLVGVVKRGERGAVAYWYTDSVVGECVLK